MCSPSYEGFLVKNRQKYIRKGVANFSSNNCQRYLNQTKMEERKHLKMKYVLLQAHWGFPFTLFSHGILPHGSPFGHKIPQKTEDKQDMMVLA